MKLKIQRLQNSGDLHTPVGLYLALRDLYPGALLLESSDYHSAGNSSSYICLQPLSSIVIQQEKIEIRENSRTIFSLQLSAADVPKILGNYLQSFQQEGLTNGDGIYGYISYDAVRHFEDIELNKRMASNFEHPELIFSAFRFVIHLNHFNDTMNITEYCPEEEKTALPQLLAHIRQRPAPLFPFQTTGDTQSNLTDEHFLEMIRKAKTHCRRGDVFQVVLSRQYSVGFKGDDVNVYRALRRINPSPYLYYFDFGSFRIFGSSPESQIKIKDGVASLNPIAGTYRRTGNDKADEALAEQLSLDPKENAEHAMLVDLARNDLSRGCHNVQVATYKEVQFFSHVIHLVSKVTGEMKDPREAIRSITDTFPAGTLSGAPKHRAMQIIDALEPQSRGFYGGAVGFISFSGQVNLAILIRSFLSQNNQLFFQAGAGIVDASNIESELQEVNNKLAALHKAILEATTSNQ